MFGEQLFRVDGRDLQAGTYTLGVFNMDYFVHQAFAFQLEVRLRLQIIIAFVYKLVWHPSYPRSSTDDFVHQACSFSWRCGFVSLVLPWLGPCRLALPPVCCDEHTASASEAWTGRVDVHMVIRMLSAQV